MSEKETVENNEENKTEEQKEELFTKEDLENAVKNRVKNAKMENARLAQENNALKEKMSQLSSTNEADLQTSAAPQPQQQAQPQDAVSQAEINALQNYQQFINEGGKRFNKMRKEDPKLDSLIDKGEHLAIPEDIAAHILTTLPEKTAKNVLMKVLTNENANLKMQNSLAIDNLNGDENNTLYKKWLQSNIGVAPEQEGEESEMPVNPDGETDENYENDGLDTFLKNQFG